MNLNDAIKAWESAIERLDKMRSEQIGAVDAVYWKETHVDRARHAILFNLLETGTNEARRKLERDQALYDDPEYQSLLVELQGLRSALTVANAEVEYASRLCTLGEWRVRTIQLTQKEDNSGDETRAASHSAGG